MPLTESGRAFWSMDETEALLANAPRWGFSAAKLRENVAELSHFSTKQVSSKLADLQIQNRSGSRPTPVRKRLGMGQTLQIPSPGSNKAERRDRYLGAIDERTIGVQGALLSISAAENGKESPYESQTASFTSVAAAHEASKKRERFPTSDLSPPEAKRPAVLDSRLTHRLPLVFPSAAGTTAFGHPQNVTALPSPFASAAPTFGYPPSLLLPPLLSLPGANPLFTAAETSMVPEAGTLKRAVPLKENFQSPAGTKPSLLEVPHPAIRCYASTDMFKIVIHPVILGTTVEVLIPQEPQGAANALLKIDWKLSATPFDSDFDFRRHSTLTELYHCPLPTNLNQSQGYYLHQAGEAMCLVFPLERQPYPSLETAIVALSALATTNAPSKAATSHEDDSHSSSSTANAASSPSSHSATPNDESDST